MTVRMRLAVVLGVRLAVVLGVRLGLALEMRLGLALEMRPRALLVAARFLWMVGKEIVNPTQPGAQALA